MVSYAQNQTGTFEKLSRPIEADETFIGGKARFMHKGKREEKIKGRGTSGKTIVMGVLERHGEVRTKVVPDTSKETLQSEVREHVTLGAEVFTDQNPSYVGLSPEYLHDSVNHAADEYVKGRVHTQGIDDFWSLLKRSLKGTYVSVEPFHLFRYLDEQSFRFNARKIKDSDRFFLVTASVRNRRLTYKQLTGNSQSE